MMTTIHIENVEDAEPKMLQDVLTMLAHHVGANTLSINIQVTPRVPDDAPAYKHPGWCEYLCMVQYRQGSRLVIGAIQRTKGAQTEFHS